MHSHNQAPQNASRLPMIPVTFALVLAVLSVSAVATSERLWLPELAQALSAITITP